jgi:hypothetical protein
MQENMEVPNPILSSSTLDRDLRSSSTSSVMQGVPLERSIVRTRSAAGRAATTPSVGPPIRGREPQIVQLGRIPANPPVRKVRKQDEKNFSLAFERLLGDFQTTRLQGLQPSTPLIEAILNLPLLLKDKASKNGNAKMRSTNTLQRVVVAIETVPAITGEVDKERKRRAEETPRTRSNQREERPAGEQQPPLAIPTEKLYRMVEEGGCGEVIKYFENTARSNGIAPLTEENTRKITDLFPRASDREALPVQVLAPENTIRISEQELVAGLLKLPKQRAAGMSGWTYELIQQVCKPFLAPRQSTEGYNNIRADDPGEPLLEKVLFFVNEMLSGKGGDSHTWNKSKLIPLLKKNNEGIRPIAVDDSWIRVISRLASAKMATLVAGKLVPYQYAIGIPRGTETIAHVTQTFAKGVQREGSTQCIQQLDMENAFGSISRLAIYDAINRDFPALLPYYHWAYKGATDMVLASGELLAESTSGVRQGDPLGPMFFCMGIQRALEHVGALYPNHEIMSYMDDITIMGDQEQMGQIILDFTTQLNLVGLKLSPVKCERLVNALHHQRQDPWYQGITSSTGLKILGTYVGDEAGQTNYAEDKIRLYSDILEWIKSLPVNIGCPLIKSCVNSRPIYMARSMPSWTIMDSLQKFDDDIDKTLLALVGNGNVQLSRISQIQRSKPMRKGGLGIMRISAIAEGAYTSSYLESMFYITNRSVSMSENFRQAAKSNLLFKNLQLVAKIAPLFVVKDNENLDTLACWAGEVNEEEMEVPKQSELSKKVVESLEKELDELLDRDKLGKAWILSTKYSGSGSYLMPNVCLEIPEIQYKAMLNMRLLSFPQPLVHANPIGQHNIRGFQCHQCRNTAQLDANENGLSNFDVGEGGEVDLRFHAMNCKRTGATKINRHNLVVRELITLFKCLKLTCGGETLLQNSNHRLDATVTLAGESTFFIDVTIVNPACHSYVLTLHSDEIDLVAANNAAKKKRDKYAPHFALQEPALDINKLVPFVIESSGKFGSEAEQFLEKLKSQARGDPFVNYHFRRFKNNVWKIIARGNAMCFLEFHKSLGNVILHRTNLVEQ